jgi:IS30 family transposase
MRHVLDGTVVIAAAPERRSVGVSRRESYQRPRPRKLTIEDREAVRSAATSGRSLRSLAVAFGVSHETIRAVLRDRSSDTRVVALETVTQKC